MSDMKKYARQLYESFPLRRNVVTSAIRDLKIPPGSRGLDAGCGIGLPALLLAEETGSEGHITGLDLSPELLIHARKNAAESGISKPIDFIEGNINNLPFKDDTFDWAWSMDCVGYHPSETLPMLKELARVVKPEGAIFILVWSSQMLLPGYPLLEARLNATSSGIAPFVEGQNPELHFLKAMNLFQKAGISNIGVKTLVGDAHAPLSEEMKSALLSLLQMRWPGADSELFKKDWAVYKRLCHPGSSDYILDKPDYYAFFTYSMFHGRISR